METSRQASRLSKYKEAIEAILASMLLVLFAYLVNWTGPLKWLSFIPFTAAGLLIGRRLFSNSGNWSVLFRNRPSLLSYCVIGVLMGLAGALYYRGNYAMPLFPLYFRGFVWIAVCTGCMEELLFRGYVQQQLQQLNPVLGITGSALAHAGYKACLFLPPAMAFITPVWLFFTWSFGAFLLIGTLRYFSKSLWPPLLVHAVFDLLVYAQNAEAPVWVW
jgi:membrane protease YdiL (CAAX protease family)